MVLVELQPEFVVVRRCDCRPPTLSTSSPRTLSVLMVVSGTAAPAPGRITLGRYSVSTLPSGSCVKLAVPADTVYVASWPAGSYARDCASMPPTPVSRPASVYWFDHVPFANAFTACVRNAPSAR